MAISLRRRFVLLLPVWQRPDTTCGRERYSPLGTIFLPAVATTPSSLTRRGIGTAGSDSFVTAQGGRGNSSRFCGIESTQTQTSSRSWSKSSQAPPVWNRGASPSSSIRKSSATVSRLNQLFLSLDKAEGNTEPTDSDLKQF